MYMNFSEQNRCVVSGEMSYESFTPIWSHINENEKHPSKTASRIESEIPTSLNNFGRDAS